MSESSRHERPAVAAMAGDSAPQWRKVTAEELAQLRAGGSIRSGRRSRRRWAALLAALLGGSLVYGVFASGLTFSPTENSSFNAGTQQVSAGCQGSTPINTEPIREKIPGYGGWQSTGVTVSNIEDVACDGSYIYASAFQNPMPGGAMIGSGQSAQITAGTSSYDIYWDDVPVPLGYSNFSNVKWYSAVIID